MTADILIKTYRNDLVWLWQCLKQLRHFTSGFRTTIIVAPPDCQPDITRFGLRANERLLIVNESNDPYYFQQSVKLNAHNYTDAKFICFMDSDCLARRHFEPLSFYVNGKPHYLYTPYASLGDNSVMVWKHSTERIIGRPVEHEFMRRHPAFHPRETLQELDLWFIKTHGLPSSQFMIHRGREFGLSEFNVIGAWAWNFAHDRYQWINTIGAKPGEIPENYVEQFWSYGGPQHPHNAGRYNAMTLIA
jgi:hypothetical protein